VSGKVLPKMGVGKNLRLRWVPMKFLSCVMDFVSHINFWERIKTVFVVGIPRTFGKYNSI